MLESTVASESMIECEQAVSVDLNEGARNDMMQQSTKAGMCGIVATETPLRQFDRGVEYLQGDRLGDRVVRETLLISQSAHFSYLCSK